MAIYKVILVLASLTLFPKLLDTHSVLSDHTSLASGWGTELGTNPDSIKSCTGHTVEVIRCPVLYCFKLQPCITTSTIESTYIAIFLSLFLYLFLFMAQQAAIPLMKVTSTVNKGLTFVHNQILATFHET